MSSPGKQTTFSQEQLSTPNWLQLPNRLSDQYYTLVGLSSFILVILLYFVNLNWTWLSNLQANDTYKQLTGLFILTLVISQWQLAINRLLLNRRSSSTTLAVHRWIGALMPVIFYFHSSQLGHGYQTLLVCIFLSNSFIGLINPKACGIGNRLYYINWLLLHLSCASFMIILLMYHIFVTYTYS